MRLETLQKMLSPQGCDSESQHLGRIVAVVAFMSQYLSSLDRAIKVAIAIVIAKISSDRTIGCLLSRGVGRAHIGTAKCTNFCQYLSGTT